MTRFLRMPGQKQQSSQVPQKMENNGHLYIPISPIVDSQPQPDNKGIDYIFDRSIPEMRQPEDQRGNKDRPIGIFKKNFQSWLQVPSKDELFGDARRQCRIDQQEFIGLQKIGYAAQYLTGLLMYQRGNKKIDTGDADQYDKEQDKHMRYMCAYRVPVLFPDEQGLLFFLCSIDP